MNKFSDRFERYLQNEIAIDFKTCAYFFCMAFFYCFYRVSQGSFSASIPHLFEMLADAYVTGYLQVYLLRNFDEAQSIGKGEVFGMLLCCFFHTAVSFAFGWFEGKWAVMSLFFLFMLICYFTVWLCNRIRRRMDTKNLNQMLEKFKKGEEHG